MSRYIDADALIKRWDEISVRGRTEFDQEIMVAPSIDIVQCSECKYASDDGTYGCMCEHFNDASDAYHRMWSDDFCSCGERKE